MPTSPQVAAIRRKRYGHLRAPDQVYYDLLAELIGAHTHGVLLNVGCGSGNADKFDWKRHKRSNTLIGLDVDEDAATNPNLTGFVQIHEGKEWPIAAESVDFATSRSVMEHVRVPEAFFGNLMRVLKKGGKFLFITPNVLHPAMMSSALLPTGVKAHILSGTTGRRERDVFPTVYRVNTRRAVQKKARRAGFVVEHIEVGEWKPSSYLDFSLSAFRLAQLYYHFVSLTGLERYFGINIIGVLRKP